MQQPVFVDDTGRRHRWTGRLGWASAVLLAAYLVALVVAALTGTDSLGPFSVLVPGHGGHRHTLGMPKSAGHAPAPGLSPTGSHHSGGESAAGLPAQAAGSSTAPVRLVALRAAAVTAVVRTANVTQAGSSAVTGSQGRSNGGSATATTPTAGTSSGSRSGSGNSAPPTSSRPSAPPGRSQAAQTHGSTVAAARRPATTPPPRRGNGR